MKESPSIARSVGTKTVSNQMHVADLTPRPYHHVNNQTELSPNHPSVWHRLVVIWRRGSLSPCHNNDIEIILPEISKANDWENLLYSVPNYRFCIILGPKIVYGKGNILQSIFLWFYRGSFFNSTIILKQHSIVKHWEELCSPLSTRHSSFRITMST